MEYHNNRFEDFSLLIFKNDLLIALLPANKVDNIVYSHQGLSYGGLILSESIIFEDVFNAFKTVLKYFNENAIETIFLKSIPKIYCTQPSDEIDYLLFKVNAKLYRRDVSIVIDNCNILNIKSSNRIRGLKKAVKQNLKVLEVDKFDDFWDEILIPNLQERHNTKPVHSLQEITQLKNNFPNDIRQFNAYKDNKIVAGVTIFETNKVAHAQYISANEAKQELGSLDIIFNTLINEVFKDKSYFDFGISNHNQGQNINKGLMSWKESFGGRSIVHDFYTIETKNHKLLETTFI